MASEKEEQPKVYNTASFMDVSDDDSDDNDDPTATISAPAVVMPHKFYIHDLCEFGNETKLEEILNAINSQKDYSPNNEIDLDLNDYWDCSPLHVAILSYNHKAMKLLLDNGAEILNSCEGSPPLHVAISLGVIEKHIDDAVKAAQILLVDGGADVNCMDDYLRTPLHIACSIGVLDIVKLLCTSESGTDAISTRDVNGNTPLGLASKNGHVDVVSYLLSLEMGKATVNVSDDNGETPVYLASSKCLVDVIAVLINEGKADLSINNIHGFDAAEIAQRRGFVMLSKFLNSLPENLSNNIVQSLKDVYGSAEARKGVKTLVSSHPVCLEHYTCEHPYTRTMEVPNENRDRLSALLDEDYGLLKAREFDGKVKYFENPPRANFGDILRVHEYPYVRKIQRVCTRIPDDPKAIGALDNDTSVSHRSYEAALRASGAVIHAVKEVCNGNYRNAFCAIRPPGHHAGPSGLVTCGNDTCGSSGFCLLNNVAIGAAYARSHFEEQGINKICILDFDVHHGNGTEAIIRNLIPNLKKQNIDTGYCNVSLQHCEYKPWRDETDSENVLFASVHGFGSKLAGMPLDDRVPKGYWFYPGSGATSGLQGNVEDLYGHIEFDETSDEGGSLPSYNLPAVKEFSADNNVTTATIHPEPRIINVGLSRASKETWRKVWRDEILTQVLDYSPDLIFISAGFDGHEKDIINYGFLSLLEEDYRWLTNEIVKVANTVCEGRVVSVLEGGYRIHGKTVSPFGRSVAAHVMALAEPGIEVHDPTVWQAEREREKEASEIENDLEAELAALKAEAAEMENETNNGGVVTTTSSGELAVEAQGEGRRKRRRGGGAPVDYLKLNAEFEAEQQKAKRAKLDAIENRK